MWVEGEERKDGFEHKKESGREGGKEGRREEARAYYSQRKMRADQLRGRRCRMIQSRQKAREDRETERDTGFANESHMHIE